jgi:hypothetical protein
MSLKMQISYHRFDWAPVPGKKRFPGVGRYRAHMRHTRCHGDQVLEGSQKGVIDRGIQGHQAEAKMRHPQAPFRPLSDVNRGELPPLRHVHYASQPL